VRSPSKIREPLTVEARQREQDTRLRDLLIAAIIDRNFFSAPAATVAA
jgi:hypothetical protein